MAKSPESLTAQIQGLSGTKRDLIQLNDVLKRSDQLLSKANYDVLASMTTQLDPSEHSLGFLYLLDALSLKGQTSEEVALLISRFIEYCDAGQISLAAGKFIAVSRRLKDYAMRVKEPIRAVGPLITAVKKLQLCFPENLTSLHPDALLLCVLSKCYKAGLSIIQDDVYEVDKPKDFLLYCYYGGMVCIGQKQFNEASQLLFKVITAPMSSLSAIAVEAYKKYALISLIQSGKFSTNLPKYSSPGALKYLKQANQLYVDFAKKYETWKVSDMESFVQGSKWRFEEDGNLGLANQAVSSMYKHSIQRLTKTYLTLSLQDIAERVSLKNAKEAEMHVLKMIQDGEIHGEINQKDGMVSFLEDPEQYKTCGMVDQMNSSIQRIMALSKKLTAMDESMACDSMYLKKKFGGEKYHHGEFDMDDYNEEAMHFGNGRGFGRDQRMRFGPRGGFRM